MREFDSDTTLEIDSIARIQFYTYKSILDETDPTKPELKVVKEFIPAVYCSKLYAEKLDEDSD